MKFVSMLTILSFFILSGCSSQIQFVKKPNQSKQQFFQDKVYCQSGASGQRQDRRQGERLVPFEECMLNLGYSPK